MKLLRKILSAALAVALLTATAFPLNSKQFDKLKDAEHKSMHMIMMGDRDANGKFQGGLCTAYAVGPHTLLTAEHCNDQYATSVYIDADRDAVHAGKAMSYTVARSFDKQDHMLLDVSGIVFPVYIPLAAAQERTPIQGEHFYFWGCPQGLRDQYREGYVLGSMPFSSADALEAEVDAHGPRLYLFSGPVIGGDSGSSVFNEKGERIGVVTFGIDNGQIIGIFPLEFTQAQIDAAMQPVTKKEVVPTRPTQDSASFGNPMGRF